MGRNNKLSSLLSRVQLTKSIAMFVAMDLHPTAVVDGHGFKALIKLLEPGYTVATSYRNLSSRVQPVEGTANGRFTAASCLLYMDKPQAYITLTCHWIDDDWKLNSKVLFTAEMPERHTGIAERLKQGSVDWRIPDDCIVSIVHDNASN